MSGANSLSGQERLPKEVAAHGIDTMPAANRYLDEHYRAAFNEEFAVPAAEPGSAFVPFRSARESAWVIG